MQKIIRVREGSQIPLNEYTETWNVVRVLQREEDEGGAWLSVLLERDEEDSQRKQSRHDEYLRAVDRMLR